MQSDRPHLSLLRNVSMKDCQRQHIIRSAARAAANAAALSEKPTFSARFYNLHKFLPVEVAACSLLQKYRQVRYMFVHGSRWLGVASTTMTTLFAVTLPRIAPLLT